jgi:hypothetical protein
MQDLTVFLISQPLEESALAVEADPLQAPAPSAMTTESLLMESRSTTSATPLAL